MDNTALRKVCVVTDSRAEYGQMTWIMKEIEKDPEMQLQTLVMGAHLSERFGYTYKEIEKDGFTIDEKVETLKYNDDEVGIGKMVGTGCIGLADAYGRLKPDIVLILGDRYEMLAAAIAAYVAKIPIAHLHGGEVTFGVIDEGIRHSISRCPTLHFAGTDFYRKRLIQMGEKPNMVFNYGAPGADNFYKLKTLDKEGLSKDLKFNLDGEVAIVTYHPVTLENQTSHQQILTLLETIDQFNFKVILPEQIRTPTEKSSMKRS